MDLFVLYVGFAAIAGLLAGYVLGRKGARWALPALWGATVLIAVIYAMWLDAGTGPGGVTSAVVLYGIIAPFFFSAVLAGLLGTTVRVILNRREGR